MKALCNESIADGLIATFILNHLQLMNTQTPPADSAQYQGLGNTLDHLPRCIQRGIALLIRVSSEIQRKNVGSINFQRDQIRHLEPYGATTDHVRVFDATAESAKPGADRPIFRQLLAAVKVGDVGVVVVTDVDRVARNDPDAEELYDALASIGGMLVINGEICDPGNPGHRMILRIRTAIAQFENDQRAFRSLSSRVTKARNLEAQFSVATCLIWGSPDDPDFRREMKQAGLEDRLSESALAMHRAKVVRDDRRYFIFPFPNRDILAAGELAIRWLLETRDINAVLERIEHDPAWPKPGMFPVACARRYRPGERLYDWKPLIDRTDGKNELARVTLYGWLRSPSLYGIYAFKSKRLKQLSRAAAALGTTVWEEGAFPGLATPDDYQRVREILKNPARPRIRGSWDGVRNHAVPLVVCSHPMPRGEICGRRLHAMYATGRGGEYRYLCVACGIRGHRYSLPPNIDDIVLDIVCSVFTPDRLRDELDRIRCDQGADASLIKQLEADVMMLRARVEWDDDRAFRAKQEGNLDDIDYYDGQRIKHQKELKDKEHDLKRANATREQEKRITDQEYDLILSLASDLPTLLELARPVEGKVREILRELIRRVHTRYLGLYTYYVEVEFRSGQRQGRTVISRSIRAPQPIRALAYDRLHTWLAPSARSTEDEEAMAVEYAQALAVELNSALGNPKPAWTANRTFTAAYMLSSEDEVYPRTGIHESPSELATRLDLPPKRVLAAALRGHLGPAKVHGGEVVVRPTGEELHKFFPVHAHREVAERAGWPVDDLVTLLRLQKETGWDRYLVERVAERGSGIVTDSVGRRYTRRSQFKIPVEGELERILERSIPKGANKESGRWYTWTEAKTLLPGVSITTFENHTTTVRPGFGDHGIATVYIWIDSQVEARVRKPTLEEAVKTLGLESVTHKDFFLRGDALAQMQERFGAPTYDAWVQAVKAGHVLEVKAQGPHSRRLRAWAYIPAEVLCSKDSTIVQRFLRGDLIPPIPLSTLNHCDA